MDEEIMMRKDKCNTQKSASFFSKLDVYDYTKG